MRKKQRKEDQVKKTKNSLSIFKNKFLQWGLFALIIFVMSWQSIMIIYNRRVAFFARDYALQFNSLQQSYDNSQYVKKNVPFIPDEVFEAYAGGVFLKGLNPTHIVSDHPPLGRYLVSLTILIFDNANIVTIFAMLFSVIGLFLVSKQILKNKFLALVPLAIFMNEPLFTNKFIYTPLPEPTQLPFIIFGFYFFVKGMSSSSSMRGVSSTNLRSNHAGIFSNDWFKTPVSFSHLLDSFVNDWSKIWWFILTSTMLGFVISTRFFVTGTGMLAAMVLSFVFLKNQQKRFVSFVITLPLSLLVLILSYFRVVQDSHSIMAVFKVQKYILWYHKSALTNPLSFWDLLLFNRWHTWWGNYAISHDNQWIIVWPISLILSIGLIVYRFFKQITLTPAEIVLLLWIFVYTAILSIGYTSTRYFLPILPFLYILATSFVVRVYLYWRKV